MCGCPFCTQAQSSCNINNCLHLSNVAITAQDTNGGIAGVNRVPLGVGDVLPNFNEGVSGAKTRLLLIYLYLGFTLPV